LAWRGFGVWSIVVQQLSGNLASVALLWGLTGWRPLLRFRFESLRRMLRFGSSFTAVSLLDVFARHLSSAVIGRRFTAADVGLYSRATQIEELPVMTTYYAVSRPSLSLFAASQDHEARLVSQFRSTLSHLALVGFPVMTGLAVIARPLVITLLTPKWLGCVPFVRLLCAVGILFPLQRINLNVIIAKGRSTLFLKLELARTGMVVLFIAIAAYFGIKILILSQILAMAITWYVNGIWAGRMLSYPFWKQLIDVSPYAFASGAMVGSMVLLERVPLGADLNLLIGQTFVGACSYIGLCWLLQLSAFSQLKGLARLELSRFRHWTAA